MYVADVAAEYRLRPDFPPTLSTRQEFSTWIWTNADGFRDCERGPKQQGVYRILAIGDSFTWGAYGVDMHETYTAMLEEMLNSVEDRRYEVLNAGVPGWGTDNELAFYRRYGEAYQADLVLLGFSVANDFLDNLQQGDLSVLNGNLVRTTSIEEDTPLLKKLHNFLVTHSILARWGESRLLQIPVVQSFLKRRAMREGELLVAEAARIKQLFGPVGEDKEASRLHRATRELIREFKEVCDCRRTSLCILAIPAAFQVDTTAIDFIVTEYGINSENLEGPQRFLRRVCLENDILLIDPLEDFQLAHRTTPLYWEFNPHFNREGNRRAAAAVHRSLVEAGLLEQGHVDDGASAD